MLMFPNANGYSGDCCLIQVLVEKVVGGIPLLGMKNVRLAFLSGVFRAPQLCSQRCTTNHWSFQALSSECRTSHRSYQPPSVIIATWCIYLVRHCARRNSMQGCIATGCLSGERSVSAGFVCGSVHPR